MRRRMYLTRLLFLFSGIFLFALTFICASAAAPKRVLVLNPFARDVEPYSAAVSAFRSTLARVMGEPVDFYEIPLDLARFNGAEGEIPLVAFLKDRIKSHPVDLVVPIGGAGAQFAARHRERLFPDTPVLVVAAEPRMIPPEFLETNATLVTQNADLGGMVEDILKIHPQTKNIAVVFGASPLERFWVDQCRREFGRFADRVGFTWLNDLPLDQVVDRCSELPPDSFILHGLFLVDAAGIPSEKNEALRRLHESANAPIFGYFESEFGLGLIGGRLFQNIQVGSEGARTALRILRGENPESIPVRVLGPAVPVFDWRELRRWEVTEANLPAGSRVEFREPTFWEHYRWQIVGAVFFVLLQSLLIFGLLVNRARRLRGEAEAALIADISSKFVNLPPREVNQEITEAQRRICEFHGVDLSVLWQWSDRNEGSFIATHVFSLADGAQPPVEMSDGEFPWVRQEILAGRIVVHRSLDEMPREAEEDRESARRMGIRSHLTIPLGVGGGKSLGVFGLNSIRAERSWPDKLVKRMELVAQIFANALARKRADEILRESEFRLKLATDSAEAGLWMLDWKTKTFWASERAREIFGYSPEEVVDFERLKASVHPDDWDFVEAGIEESMRGDSPVNLEYRIRSEEGRERWIVSRGRPFSHSGDGSKRLFGLSMDIGERKLAEERLQQLSLVVEQSPALVVITDLVGQIIYVNRKFTEVSGYSLEECIGENPRILKSGESPPSVYEKLWTQITSGRTWRGEFHNRKKNGELYWERAIISPLVNGSGKITHYVGIKEDITEAKRSGAALRESEELNRLTFEQAAMGIAHVSIDGQWLSVNDKLCEILGYSRDELLGLNFQEMTHPEDLEKELGFTGKLLSGEIPSYALEKRYLRKDHSTAWVNLTVSLLRSAIGEPGRFISLVEDISEQRRAEMEAQELRGNLAHTGRVTLLGQMSSALAHQLSQPLGAILRNAEAAEIMLRDSSPDLEEIRAIVDDILKDDQRAGQVIDRLRSLLKRGKLETNPVDLRSVIEEVLSLIRADAATRQIRIAFPAAPDLPEVSGDRIHLQQVVLNLLVNAMDALDGKERGTPDDRCIEVSLRLNEKGSIEVRISDNGPGFPDDSLERLFEPFFTSKSKGMGVGLPVSRTIIEAHRGTIWAENRPGGGACFSFTVPVENEAETGANHP